MDNVPYIARLPVAAGRIVGVLRGNGLEGEELFVACEYGCFSIRRHPQFGGMIVFPYVGTEHKTTWQEDLEAARAAVGMKA